MEKVQIHAQPLDSHITALCLHFSMFFSLSPLGAVLLLCCCMKNQDSLLELYSLSVDYHTISSHVIFLLTSLASAFHQSGHPNLKNVTFPSPHEWKFYEEELATCLGTSRQGEVGTVQVVGRDFLTVSFVTGDTINILWANAQKLHLKGDFVYISNGRHQGHLGWVTGMDGYKLCCAKEVLQSPEFKTFIVEVRFQQFEGFIYIQAIIASSHF